MIILAFLDSWAIFPDCLQSIEGRWAARRNRRAGQSGEMWEDQQALGALMDAHGAPGRATIVSSDFDKNTGSVGKHITIFRS